MNKESSGRLEFSLEGYRLRNLERFELRRLDIERKGETFLRIQ